MQNANTVWLRMIGVIRRAVHRRCCNHTVFAFCILKFELM
jgi:hypothetical protein